MSELIRLTEDERVAHLGKAIVDLSALVHKVQDVNQTIIQEGLLAPQENTLSDAIEAISHTAFLLDKRRE